MNTAIPTLRPLPEFFKMPQPDWVNAVWAYFKSRVAVLQRGFKDITGEIYFFIPSTGLFSLLA